MTLLQVRFVDFALRPSILPLNFFYKKREKEAIHRNKSFRCTLRAKKCHEYEKSAIMASILSYALIFGDNEAATDTHTRVQNGNVINI